MVPDLAKSGYEAGSTSPKPNLSLQDLRKNVSVSKIVLETILQVLSRACGHLHRNREPGETAADRDHSADSTFNRTRIYIEEKAKVVAAVWGTGCY